MAVPSYDPDDYPRVAVTVDVVVLTVRDGTLQVVLVRRGEAPFEDQWALPGGFVRPDETLAEAAVRELREETGVDAAAHLEQFGAYGDPDRDPRMRVVTVAHLAVLRDVPAPVADSDAADAELVAVNDVLGRRPRYPLAFDHRRILEDGVEVARTKLEYTSLATAFVGPEFTLSQLREVYEAAWGQRVDPANFRRKILSSGGMVVPTGKRAAPGPEGGKPPEVFTGGGADRLDPPLRRAPLPSQPTRPSRKAARMTDHLDDPEAVERYRSRYPGDREATFDAYVDVFFRGAARGFPGGWTLFSRCANGEPALVRQHPELVDRAERTMQQAGYVADDSRRPRRGRTWIRRGGD